MRLIVEKNRGVVYHYFESEAHFKAIPANYGRHGRRMGLTEIRNRLAEECHPDALPDNSWFCIPLPKSNPFDFLTEFDEWFDWEAAEKFWGVLPSE